VKNIGDTSTNTANRLESRAFFIMPSSMLPLRLITKCLARFFRKADLLELLRAAVAQYQSLQSCFGRELVGHSKPEPRGPTSVWCHIQRPCLSGNSAIPQLRILMWAVRFAETVAEGVIRQHSKYGSLLICNVYAGTTVSIPPWTNWTNGQSMNILLKIVFTTCLLLFLRGGALVSHTPQKPPQYS
jgi:hypothetical protein